MNMDTYSSAEPDFRPIGFPHPEDFLYSIDNIRTRALSLLNKEKQAELGQFLTPPQIAWFMSGLFSNRCDVINLLDPGAGVGTLSAAFIARRLFIQPTPKNINLTAYEIDPIMLKGLYQTCVEIKRICENYGVGFENEIKNEDFITSSVEALNGKNSLFNSLLPSYNTVIMNPPYHKINSDTPTRHRLRSVGIETTNLYTAFLWLVVRLLDPESEMVAIVPRSFCNGAYFKNFRLDFLKKMAIQRIHLFASRDKAFQETDVLQENIIIHAVNSKDRWKKVVISQSNDPSNQDMVIREVDQDQIVHPDDPDAFIRIVPDEIGQQISQQMSRMSTTLKELGISVSTGRVVDFRARDLLKEKPEKDDIPLIYPGNFKNGYIVWPVNGIKKPTALISRSEIDNLVLPSAYYVLVKRFSSKEEKRRISAAVFDPTRVPGGKIGIENHINYYHKRYGGLSLDMAKGLTLFLNSTIVDQYFRQFSGHTQVNATDLQKIKYPTAVQLISLGQNITDSFPNQDEIDKLIDHELFLSEGSMDANQLDPIRAKKRIREALAVLQLLGVPRAQQNDRSALTLLSLLHIKVDTSWSEANSTLIGITEMMDYFRNHFGVNYAPNTRETVRRQTIHQFLQLGLVIANPDNPTRPINSPKTRYLISPSALKLLRMFGTPEWEGNLRDYLKSTESFVSLQIRERTMNMVPVTLPGGDEIMLTSGDHNDLIKKVIENFCPRFTPGGKVIYIGDAGRKLNESEISYFDQLGIKVDKHGKMPDLVVDFPDKNWLVLIEAVTSHGPIDLKRHNELHALFESTSHGLVFITAFETRKIMHRYLGDIAWETDVWVAESPSHLIHFNGERFLGPYSGKVE